VLIVMLTGRLRQHQGSLARATLPLVVHLQGGRHRVERAMERGKFSLDALFEQANRWCPSHRDVKPVRLGSLEREVLASQGEDLSRKKTA
jgi:hypothetical protein